MQPNLRRFLIAAALSFAPAFAQTPAPAFVHPAFPGATTPLGQQIAAVLADPVIARAHWGIAVTALDGTPIFGLNEGQYFRPASNTKLYTTSAATALLGLASTVTTYVDADAPIAKGTIKGNVSLHGVGDANLSGRPIPYQTPAEVKAAAEQHLAPPDPLRYIDEMAANIAAAGVKKITGDIIGDDSLWRWEPYPGSWSIDDMVGYDGSPTAALTIDDNQLDVTVTPGTKVGDPATITFTPDVGFYKLDAEVTTVAAPAQGGGRGPRGGADGPRLKTDREIGSRTLQIFGTVAIGQPRTQSIAITDPPEFAAMALKQKLEAHGVKVEGVARSKHRTDKTTMGYMAEVMRPDSPLSSPGMTAEQFRQQETGLGLASEPTGKLYVAHQSITLADDLAVTLKVSQNLHAELFLRRLSPPGDMGLAPGAHVLRTWLVNNAHLDPDDIVLYDGSGMSSHNLVTPRTTAALLAYDAKQTWFPTFKAALPVGGVDGTISTRFSDAPLKGHVFAKTGTLGESRALSGYLDCASGKQVIFSIMADTHSPLGGADRVAMDKIVAAIAAGN